MKKFTKLVLSGALLLSLGGTSFLAAPASYAAVTTNTSTQIAALIQEKQQLINQKKWTTDWQVQKALGIRISEIEREIQALKNGQNTTASTPEGNPTDVTGQINALIQQKQELVAQKKASRDKNEQKALGKQIDEIEKQIKQLKKGQ